MGGLPLIALHVNSSLPRAGSELLQALLSQHPDVYASATSPLLEYWYGAQGNLTLPEVKSQPADQMQAAFAGFCRAGAEGYYAALTDKTTVVDKSRGWLEYAELLWAAYPEARIVCMVRDPEAIVESLERIYLANVGHPETRPLPSTPKARREAWLAPDSKPLGLALRRLYLRQQQPDSRVLYVSYDNLCANPVSQMQEVFGHLQLSSHSVNPFHVVKAATEDDRHYGIFGAHHVHSTVTSSATKVQHGNERRAA